jgi:hypothetical protein
MLIMTFALPINMLLVLPIAVFPMLIMLAVPIAMPNMLVVAVLPSRRRRPPLSPPRLRPPPPKQRPLPPPPPTRQRPPPPPPAARDDRRQGPPTTRVTVTPISSIGFASSTYSNMTGGLRRRRHWGVGPRYEFDTVELKFKSIGNLRWSKLEPGLTPTSANEYTFRTP